MQPVVDNYCSYPSTVRAYECDLLIPQALTSNRCAKCTKYRNTLRASFRNYVKPIDVSSVTKSSSHANLRYLSTPQRSARAGSRRADSTAQEHRIKGLEKRITKVINNQGVRVDESLQDDLVGILNHTP